MRLTVHTDYALRLMMYLAMNDEKLVTIGQIAAHFEISKNHLMKVALALSNLGLVDAVRGRYGGLKLAREASQIRLGEIARPLEKDSALVACFPPSKSSCNIDGACRLKGVLANAQEAFFSVLDETSLAALTTNNAALAKLLLEEVQ